METLIDLFELNEPVVETYRAYDPTPQPSVSFEVDVDYDGEDSCVVASAGHPSERTVRARLWSSED